MIKKITFALKQKCQGEKYINLFANSKNSKYPRVHLANYKILGYVLKILIKENKIY